MRFQAPAAASVGAAKEQAAATLWPLDASVPVAGGVQAEIH